MHELFSKDFISFLFISTFIQFFKEMKKTLLPIFRDSYVLIIYNCICLIFILFFNEFNLFFPFSDKSSFKILISNKFLFSYLFKLI